VCKVLKERNKEAKKEELKGRSKSQASEGREAKRRGKSFLPKKDSQR
jgi:hypothetical protein